MMMTKTLNTFFLVLLTLSLAAASTGCSINQGNKSPSGPEPYPQPDNSGPVIDELTEQQRQAFENWKARLVKSCDSSDVFELRELRGHTTNERPPRGIDPILLLNHNNHSLIVSHEHSGEFAVLGGTHSFSGTMISTVDQTETVGGQTHRLQAEFRLENSRCSVILYGKKVYEVALAQSFDVRAAWSTTNLNADPVTALTKLSISGSLAEVSEHGIINSLSQAIAPGLQTIKLLADHFGISEQDATDVFRLSPSLSFANAVRLLADLSSPGANLWFNSRNRRFVGNADTLIKLFDGSPHSVEFEWRIAPAHISVGETSNDTDTGSIKLVASIEIASDRAASSSRASGASRVFRYTLQNLRLDGLKPFDDTEASHCVRHRVKILNQLSSNSESGTENIRPSFGEAVEPCSGLSSNIDTLIHTDGTLKGLIAEVLTDIRASHQTRYNGWDRVLSTLAREDLENGVDIRADLDPKGSSKVIEEAANYLTGIRSLIQKSTHLSTNKDPIYEMGLAWAFTGQAISNQRVARIVDVFDNTMIPFKRSTETLVDELARSGGSNEAALKFGAAIDRNYKAEAVRALELARSLNYKDWQETYFDQILQKRLSLSDLKSWSGRLQGIHTELIKYPALTSHRGTLTKLLNDWLSNGQIESSKIGEFFAAINNAVDPFKDSAESLLRGLSESPESLDKNREALSFASKLTGEYKQTASSLRDKAIALGIEDWAKVFFESILQERPSLEQLQSWRATLDAAQSFALREAERLGDNSVFLNDAYRKQLTKTALREGWMHGDFITVEQIAELGKLRAGCEYQRGVSSIVHCVGSSLFSRKPKELLDPKFMNRYGPLALEFADHMGTLVPDTEYYSVRSTLMYTFFGSNPVWASCEETVFRFKATTLRETITALIRETDPLKKWELERGIRRILSDCR